MEENNPADMLRQIERLSRLMSGGQANQDDERLRNAITMAQSLGLTDRNAGIPKTSAAIEDGVNRGEYEIPGGGEKLRMVRTAIPFLDREYQKTLILAVKLMEMNNSFDDEALSLQCQSIRNESATDRREAMLRALKGQLSGERAGRLDAVLKIMEAGRLASKVSEWNRGDRQR